MRFSPEDHKLFFLTEIHNKLTTYLLVLLLFEGKNMNALLNHVSHIN